MVRAIADKTGKMGNSGAGWLHVTALRDLAFYLLGARPTRLQARNDVLGVGGLAAGSLSRRHRSDLRRRPGAGGNARGGRPQRSRYRTTHRRAPIGARESLILPFSEPSHRGEDWLALPRVEPGWLAGRLPGRGCRTSPRCSAFRRADAGSSKNVIRRRFWRHRQE